jgi:hypothetical protein
MADPAIAANNGSALDQNTGADLRIVPDADTRPDNGKRTDGDIASEYRAGMDNNRIMDF